MMHLYADAPLVTRAFLYGRILLSDLGFVERRVPGRGHVVDLGCGHGLFANLLAESSPARQVTGIDLSPEKIACAAATVRDRTNISFRSGDILETELPPCDSISIVDVLYLLPAAGQEELLRRCRALLKPGGLLVWKAQEQRPRWKYACTWLQEQIATSAGVTAGRRERLCFMRRDQALAALARSGFATHIIEMPSRRPYSDILYLARAV